MNEYAILSYNILDIISDCIVFMFLHMGDMDDL